MRLRFSVSERAHRCARVRLLCLCAQARVWCGALMMGAPLYSGGPSDHMGYFGNKVFSLISLQDLH